jgi:hypothetical protein
MKWDTKAFFCSDVNLLGEHLHNIKENAVYFLEISKEVSLELNNK